MNEIIIAPCTPQGKGAIALLRISGTNIRFFLSSFIEFSNKKLITDVPSHSIHHGKIYDSSKKVLDSVLFLIMDSPRTFTGEDTVEITCHNNLFIIASIIDECCKRGARYANPGEFTRRSYENKKIDLLEAEAIHDLICASNQQETRAALNQLEGSLSKEVKEIEQKLIILAAWIQGNFEFIDEEHDFTKDIQLKLDIIINSILVLLSMHEKSEKIKAGCSIACIGIPNVGKSSLFNALLNKKKAIVTDIPGTTRDVIEGYIHKEGFFLTLLDTAGIREYTTDIIEKEGILKSEEQIKITDIILLVVDLSKEVLPKDKIFYTSLINIYKNKIILVGNKIDLLLEKTEIYYSSLGIPLYKISAKNNLYIKELLASIYKKIDTLSYNEELPYLINNRHLYLLESLLHELNITKKLLSNSSIYYELLLYHIHASLSYLSGLSGKSVNEITLDMVFKEFCVGK